MVGYFQYRIVLNFDKIHSSTIEDVVSYSPSEPSPAIVYFYFRFNDSDKKTIENPIRSLIVQLWAQSTHLPEALQTSYSRLQNEHDQRTVDNF